MKKKRNILILSIVIIVIVVFLFNDISVRDTTINNVNIVANNIEQNEDSPSYFFVLTPDKKGNLMIDLDVVGYTNESGYVMGINQENPHSSKVNNTINYKIIYPKLVYLQYGSKIVSYSKNDRYYDLPGSISWEIDQTGQFKNVRIPNQNIHLKYVPKNISDFKLFIYATDEYAESHLDLYPFDSINSSMMFEFPNKTNLNFIIKIPDELKDYNVTPMVKSVNKNTKEINESVSLTSVYDRVYSIGTTKNINLQDNYIKVTINMKRTFLSMEVISFILLLIISVVFFIQLYKATTISSMVEHASLYIAIFSILISNFIAKRPTTDSTVFSDWVIFIVIFILSVAAFIRWRKISTHRAFDPPP
jgi:hypothetical protein